MLYNSLCELFRLVKEKGSGMVADRGFRENTVLTGTEFQFYRMKKVGGHSCTTLEVYLIPLNCSLKMIKMVNILLCVLLIIF